VRGHEQSVDPHSSRIERPAARGGAGEAAPAPLRKSSGSWKGVRAEARTVELRAVAQLGRAAARARNTLPPRSAAPAAAAAPSRRRMAAASSAVAPQRRRRASDIALRRRACASPRLSIYALPTRTPCGRYLNLSSEPAGGW